MIFRVSEIGQKKGREKRPFSFVCPPPIFFRAVVSVMGRIKQHFLDQGLTAKDIPLAFACVLFVFFFCCCFLSLSFSFVSKGERSFLRLYCSGLVLMNETNSCTDARIFVRSPFPLARLLAGQIPRSLLHHLRGVHVGRRVRNPTVQNNLPAFRKHRGD